MKVRSLSDVEKVEYDEALDKIIVSLLEATIKIGKEDIYFEYKNKRNFGVYKEGGFMLYTSAGVEYVTEGETTEDIILRIYNNN